MSLLTKIAHGDVALVRDALAKFGNKSVEEVVAYIRARQKSPPPRGAQASSLRSA
ncbi:MAG: hypothetical protein WDN03_17100 [Rhizomicrobium sp.]